MTRVEVEIKELVLHGFGAAQIDGAAVADALVDELGVRLRAEPPAIAGPRAVERIDAGTSAVGAFATPHAIGRAVAERLDGSLRA